MLPSAGKIYGDADFIFQQGLAPAHTAKVLISGLLTIGTQCLISQRTCLIVIPDNVWVIVKGKMRPNNADELEAAIQATWASIAPQQGHRLIRSMPLRIDAVISFERSPNQVLHNQEHTFQKAGISVLIIIFLPVLCDIQIFEDTQFLVFLSC